jgi:hypothetical protein
MPRKKIPPIHPGEILLEEFLKPLGLTQYRLAKSLSVPPRRIRDAAYNLIIHFECGSPLIDIEDSRGT